MTEAPEGRAELPEIIARMYDSLERGDFTTFDTCFTSGARIWHNVDEQVQIMSDAAGVLQHLARISNSVRYKDRRHAQIVNVVFLQHVLTADLKSGDALRIPAIMRIELSDEGKIDWMEEYYDSRHADVVMNAVGAASH